MEDETEETYKAFLWVNVRGKAREIGLEVQDHFGTIKVIKDERIVFTFHDIEHVRAFLLGYKAAIGTFRPKNPGE